LEYGELHPQHSEELETTGGGEGEG
jgi:hypothetical protein